MWESLFSLQWVNRRAKALTCGLIWDIVVCICQKKKKKQQQKKPNKFVLGATNIIVRNLFFNLDDLPNA